MYSLLTNIKEWVLRAVQSSILSGKNCNKY